MKKYSSILKIILPSRKILNGLKNASYLSIGHFFAMVINLFAFIYIARLLGPSDYGIYATVVAFVGLFSVVSFTGVNKVVLREGAKNFDQMGNYFEKILGVKIFLTLIAIAICIIGSFIMPYPLQVKLFIVLYSFTLIYTSFHWFFVTVYHAAEKMQYASALTIFNRILFVPLAITFLFLGYGLLSLFVISLSIEILTLIVNYKLTKKFVIFKFWNKIKWEKSLLKPALIFSILSFAVLLTTRIDLVMISLLGASKDVGIYSVANQITHTGVIAQGLLATGFFPIFVKAFHNNVVKWKKLVKYAFLLGVSLLLIAIVGAFFSEQFVRLLFGVKYSESGAILSVLIFYLVIVFSTFPFTNTLQATHNEGKILKVCWIGPCLNIVLNYLFFKLFGLVGIAYATLVVGGVTLPITILITWSALKKQKRLV